MSSSASWRLMAFAACLTAPLGAQGPAVSPGLERRVAQLVAGTWAVDTAGLVLAWSSFSRPLPSDSGELQLLGRGEGGWFALVVTPPGGQPVGVRLRAGQRVTRLVAGRALPVGARLAPEDLKPEIVTRWGPPAPDGALTPDTGWVVRRLVSPGDVLEPSRVAPPPAVAKGEPVRVRWQEGTVTVVLQGTAINDAAIGDPVRVRTAGRLGTLKGTVTGPGEARMN